MKTIKLIFLFSIYSISTYAQSNCVDRLMDYTSSLGGDSLRAGLNLILTIKDYEDIPFYEEIRFTSSPDNPQYFMLKKINPDALLGYKVFDWDNNEMKTKVIQEEEKGESLFTLKKHQSGNYKLVLYSKSPDGSCFSISKLKRKKAGEIKIPSIKLNQNTNLTELTLLKEYNLDIKMDDLPYFKKYSYVLLKGTDYYFFWEDNEGLKLKVTNLKQEDQLLDPLVGNKKIEKITCEETGIYYFTIYAKDPIRQNATLKLLYDEKTRKLN